ncbi:MAG: hypothetical protein ACTSPY_12170 [Candidatus Helarchaeota archaeon]
MQNICINKMERSGPVILLQYPENYFKNQDLTEVPLKTIPINAKEGDFTTIIFRNELIIVSYIFTLKEVENERASLYAISATIDDKKINPISFKPIFESIIEQFKACNLIKIDILKKLLPKLFSALSKDESEIKITKSCTIKIEFDNSVSRKIKKKKRINRANGMW